MYIKDYLEQFKDKKVKLYIDMDGVIADYTFGAPKDYDKKRPLFDSIKKLEEVSKMPNVELYIFSATRYTEGLEQKHEWLEKYAPFFKKDNRILISREANGMEKTAILKGKAMRDIERDGSVMILIDDDPRNLEEVSKLSDDVILLKDTALID